MAARREFLGRQEVNEALKCEITADMMSRSE